MHRSKWLMNTKSPLNLVWWWDFSELRISELSRLQISVLRNVTHILPNMTKVEVVVPHIQCLGLPNFFNSGIPQFAQIHNYLFILDISTSFHGNTIKICVRKGLLRLQHPGDDWIGGEGATLQEACTYSPLAWSSQTLACWILLYREQCWNSFQSEPLQVPWAAAHHQQQWAKKDSSGKHRIMPIIILPVITHMFLSLSIWGCDHNQHLPW